MKKSSSETEFDLSDFTCPFLDGECQKDYCTHFQRYHYTYKTPKYEEEYDEARCYAGECINMWLDCKRIEFPLPKKTRLRRIIESVI